MKHIRTFIYVGVGLVLASFLSTVLMPNITPDQVSSRDSVMIMGTVMVTAGSVASMFLYIGENL